MTTSTDVAKSGPFTWEDFLALGEDDLRELIDGELVEVDVPNRRHEIVVAALAAMLWNWSHVGNKGTVLASGYKVRITDNRGVMPDVQFFRAENEAARGQEEGLERGHPNLVVEIISPPSGRYDRGRKRAWYASIGVPEYWIIDAEARTLERLCLTNARYVIDHVAEEDETFHPPSFEGLAISLSDLWA